MKAITNDNQENSPEWNDSEYNLKINEVLLVFDDYYNRLGINKVCNYEDAMSLKNAFLDCIRIAYMLGLNNHDPNGNVVIEETPEGVGVYYSFDTSPSQRDSKIYDSKFYGLSFGNWGDFGLTIYSKQNKNTK